MQAMKRKYNTPKRDIVVMTRLNKNEKIVFDHLQKQSNLNQSEYLRKCILHKKFTVKTNKVSDDSMTDLKDIISSLGKIGSNINQIAKHLNQGGIPQYLIQDVQSMMNKLEETRFTIIETVGKYYGNY